ncbi:cytochrome P450 [Hypoxylon rubiginosum]|uniref:Cytochrome P450 n=1 Tax=Hypoxylon rubiginosum TaxID=110542 RepID=A0ACC0CRR6_9PEZI|nr:cytochrome P450 [Hypoxylon rubiginosum]
MAASTELDIFQLYPLIHFSRAFLYSTIAPLLIFLFYVIGSEVDRWLARVPNLPGPRGLPLVGSLPWLWGRVHGEQFRLWSAQYGEVFQVQLGHRTVVVVNSAASARSIFLGQREASNSRPIFYVLHKKVQSGSVTSIGTSPWDDSCKRRRKVPATALNKILNLESRAFTTDILDVSLNSKSNIVDFRDAVRKFAMNLVLTLNYGTRVEDVKELRSNAMIAEIIHVEGEITKFRDTTRNYENYIPLLRPLNTLAEWTGLRDGKYMPDIGRRRTGYHKMLLNKLKAQVAAGTDRPCIQGNVLKDPESKGLTDNEILSVSLSMMAGVDTSQPTLAWTILLLSQRPDIQRKAYQAIVDADPALLTSPDIAHTKVVYIDAFTKEISRYFTALKLGLPRATHSEVHWQGATIPPKTMVFINSWACSRDEELFANPNIFAPERWLEGGTHLHQFAFGIGGRMCVAHHLAHKALYAVFLHLIAHFEILPVEGVDDPLIADPLEGVSEKEQFVSAPRGSRARLVPRDITATGKMLGLV